LLRLSLPDRYAHEFRQPPTSISQSREITAGESVDQQRAAEADPDRARSDPPGAVLDVDTAAGDQLHIRERTQQLTNVAWTNS
jgi:hypothetical protein